MPPQSRLRFLGATRTVTGTRFLVESGGQRQLVDVGLHQGGREVRRRNWAPFAVPGAEVDALLDGATSLKMFGGYVPVRAEAELGWCAAVPRPGEQVVLTSAPGARL